MPRLITGSPAHVGTSPPKRHIFVDSFPFEEPNHRGKPKKSKTPRRATTRKPKAKQKTTNRKKATPQAKPQPRTPKPESTEGGRRVSILKWPEGALLNLG